MADVTVAHNVRLAFCDTGLWLDFPYFINSLLKPNLFVSVYMDALCKSRTKI